MPSNSFIDISNDTDARLSWWIVPPIIHPDVALWIFMSDSRGKGAASPAPASTENHTGNPGLST